MVTYHVLSIKWLLCEMYLWHYYSFWCTWDVILAWLKWLLCNFQCVIWNGFHKSSHISTSFSMLHHSKTSYSTFGPWRGWYVVSNWLRKWFKNGDVVGRKSLSNIETFIFKALLTYHFLICFWKMFSIIFELHYTPILLLYIVCSIRVFGTFVEYYAMRWLFY